MSDRASSLCLLWLCGVPKCLERDVFPGRSLGSTSDWSWIVAHLPPPPGVELHLACPARGLTQAVHVPYNGAILHLFPSPRGSAYRAYLPWRAPFRAIYEQVRPDWVHGWGTEAGFGSAALSLTADRSIVGIQGILSNYYPHMRKSLPLWVSIVNEIMTLRRAPRLLSESKYSARETKKYAPGKVGVIPHPLRDDFLRSDLGPKQKKQIVFLGALTDGKGIKDAIRAFASGSSNDWGLLCVGRGLTDYEQEVKVLTEELKVGNRVRMCGALRPEEIVGIFQESPVFLLPSYMDTGPTALKEALAMGLWPVCYDNSGPRELIDLYRYGSLSMTGNILALAESLRKALVERPWEDAVRMRGCVERVRYDLSRETIWKQLADCYTEEYWLR